MEPEVSTVVRCIPLTGSCSHSLRMSALDSLVVLIMTARGFPSTGMTMALPYLCPRAVARFILSESESALSEKMRTYLLGKLGASAEQDT